VSWKLKFYIASPRRIKYKPEIRMLKISSNLFLQLRGPDDWAALYKFLVICIMRKFTIKIEKFELRGNNSVWAGAFQLLRGRAPAQFRGSVAHDSTLFEKRGTGYQTMVV
jgi:hypothetical protein